MGLIRVLILALVVWLLWRMYQNYQVKQQKNKRKNNKLEQARMVRCEYCSIHLPQDDAVRHEDRWFCNRKHKAKFLSGNKQ